MEQLAFAVEIRTTDPGSVRRDNANSDLSRRSISQLSHAARARPTMAEYDRLPRWIAIFLKGNRTRGQLKKLLPVHASANASAGGKNPAVASKPSLFHSVMQSFRPTASYYSI